MGFSLGSIVSDIVGGVAGIGTGLLTANPLLGLGVGTAVAGAGNSLFGGSNSNSNSNQSGYTPAYSGNPYGTSAGQLGLQSLQQLQNGGLPAAQNAQVSQALAGANAATNQYYSQAGLGASSMLTDALNQNKQESMILGGQLNQQDFNNALGELGLAQYSQGNNAPQLQYNMQQQNQQNSAFGNLFGELGLIAGMMGSNSNMSGGMSEEESGSAGSSMPDFLDIGGLNG